MVSIFALLVLGCSGEKEAPKASLPSDAPIAVKKDKPTKEAPPELPPWERDVGEMNVTVPATTHTVGNPVMDFDDYNMYPDPAQKATVLQGVAVGPIGDKKEAKIWLVSARDYAAKDGPPYLEAMMVYAVDCDDCPGEETTTLAIDSVQSSPNKRASIVGVDAMRVEDVDKDGQYEVAADATYMPCCAGDADRKPYSETVIFTAKGERLVVVSTDSPSPRK